MPCGESGVQGFDARWKGVHVYSLGDFFLLDGGPLGCKLSLESLNGGLDLWRKVADFGGKFGFCVFANFFLEKAGGFVMGDGNVTVAELSVDEFPLGGL